MKVTANSVYLNRREFIRLGEHRLGEFMKRKTQMFNGDGDQVATMYAGMNLRRLFSP